MAMNAPAVSPELRAAAFNAATRQKIVSVPGFAYAAGQVGQTLLPKVGLLARVILRYSGTLTVTIGAGSAVAASRSPWAIANRIRLLANSSLPLFDTSGFGAYCALHLQDVQGISSKPGGYAGALTPTNNPAWYPPAIAEVRRFGVAAGANPIDIAWPLSVKVNEQDPIGLIVAQNPQTQLVLEVQQGQIADLVTLAGGATATLTGTWSLGIEYFEAPADPAAMPDVTFVHVWSERRDPISNVGDFPIRLVTGDTFLRIAHIVQLNGTLNRADVESLAITLNESETPYDLPRWLQLEYQRLRYGKDLPEGVFVHDFFVPDTTRDMLNSALYSDVRARLRIASTATLGTGNNFVDTVSERLVQVA
ncbi:MAG: hypothetical protein M3Q74_06055 [Pseudomonadota bacterium]|nr:hypothetical protein [Pseudomonadota bacterium]